VPRYKAVPLVLLRNRAREAGVEAALLSTLSESDRTVYERFVATDWVDEAFANRLYGIATPLVYGGGRMALRRFGQEAARADLGGVYRVVVRFMTVPALADRAATLWSKYHDCGRLAPTAPVSARCASSWRSIPGWARTPERRSPAGSPARSS
jgi:hypothetical protein